MNDNQQDQYAALVKKLTELESKLSVQLGEFKFFARDATDQAHNGWRLLAAADRIDANPDQAKEILLTALKPELSNLELGTLSDVVALPSSDPIVVAYRLKYADRVTEDRIVVEGPGPENSSHLHVIRCRPMS